MLIMLKDGFGKENTLVVPNGTKEWRVPETVPQPPLQDFSSTAPINAAIELWVTRYVFSGKFDPVSGAAVFVPDYLLDPPLEGKKP